MNPNMNLAIRKLYLPLSIALLLVVMIYQQILLLEAWADIRSLSAQVDRFHLAARGH